LPREALQTEHLNDAEVWRAMLDGGMPLTAMIRNLATMTRLDVFKSREYLRLVEKTIRDEGKILKSRVHPYHILLAQRTYGSGGGWRSSAVWNPLPSITDALDDAFYLAFGNVEPTGKPTLLALDVSGSMSAPIYNSPISCREGSMAMALITLNVEPDVQIVGFTAKAGQRWSFRGDGELNVLNISKKTRLDDAVNKVAHLPFGGTDCSLPFTWAAKNFSDAENFAVYTDNETWAGSIHPSKALEKYRNSTGLAARSAVVGMVANQFTIADPNDSGMMDFVGFDASAPALMQNFFAGNV
jgi:60 kDa SS-A/Ro ribonucleoprotein